MIDSETIDKTLDKIFNSSCFTAEIDRKFLRYLINNTLDSRILKETDIAQEFFHKDKDFNPLDSSIVRSHIYSLRKKLGTYYMTDGADDKVRLFIPKGHYKIEFLNGDKPKPPNVNKFKPYYFPIIIILVLLFLVLVIYFWNKSQNLEKEINSFGIVEDTNPIWSDFLLSELPTLLVIGDYYVYQQPRESKEKELFIRDVEINSNEDLDNYLMQNPNDKNKIAKTSLTYLGYEVPSIVSKMTRIFRGNEEKIKIKLSSELTWQDIRKNNIIFIGSPKTLGIMRFFADQLRFKISLFPHYIYYSPEKNDTLLTYSLVSYYKNGFHDDYSVMAKFQMNKKNDVMMIISFSSFGKTEILNELLSPSFVNDLRDKKIINDVMPPYFEMLYKVHGIDKSGLNTQLIHFHEINTQVLLEYNK